MLPAYRGAEVIKIEFLGKGDPFRGCGDARCSPTSCSLSRNNQSLSLNVNEAECKEIFMGLARDADDLRSIPRMLIRITTSGSPVTLPSVSSRIPFGTL